MDSAVWVPAYAGTTSRQGCSKPPVVNASAQFRNHALFRLIVVSGCYRDGDARGRFVAKEAHKDGR